ncbi:hypothetical protein BESB_056970 [Besnoitia besnoiti]|uniref:Secreted protein n=1 Tax=Besnoitia besnoiti TaxID=94643 RepID=A0A2A9MJA1_BESBE|nr:hypothetical protein BESB_056970 [Besnoitia besnoiti]PFH36046.1 hypothetical protein BESB_056970 [Besnoitia besnoiti]
MFLRCWCPLFRVRRLSLSPSALVLDCVVECLGSSDEDRESGNYDSDTSALLDEEVGDLGAHRGTSAEAGDAPSGPEDVADLMLGRLAGVFERQSDRESDSSSSSPDSAFEQSMASP